MRNFNATVSDLFQEKTAGLNLPNNTEQWKDRIYKRLLRMHPYLDGKLQGGIDWSVEPINEEEGDGVGLVTAIVGDQPIRIPILVRDFELKPIDLYVRPDGDLDVLGKDIVMKNPVHQTVDVGQKIRPHSGLDRLYNAHGIDRGGMLSKVSSYDGFREDCERMKRHIAEDFPKLAGSFDRIKEAANDHNSEWDTISVRHENRPVRGDQFHVSTFRQGEKVSSTVASHDEMFENPNSMGAKLARKAKSDGDVMAARRDLDKEAVVIDQSGAGKIVNFEPGDGATVPTEDGDVDGRVYDTVRLHSAYHDKGPVGGVFIGENSKYMYPVSEPAESSSGADPLTDQKPITDIQVGDEGFLVIPQPDKDTPRVSGPMKLVEWQQDDVGDESAVFESRLGGRVYVVQSEVLGRVQEIDRDTEPDAQQRFLVPESVKFLESDGLIMPEGQNEKEAENGVSYYMAKKGGRVEVRTQNGEEVLPAKEAQAMLASVGASAESAQKAVKEAQNSSNRVLEVKGLEPPMRKGRGENRKVAANQEVVNNLLERWANSRGAINKLAEQLPAALKRARQRMRERGQTPKRQPMMPGREGSSEMSDKQKLRPGPDEDQRRDMQDSLNAINMLNQYNASKFSESLDEIEDAKRTVAELLYRARTGEIDTVEESVVKDAMFALDTVTEGLRELKASQKAEAR